MCGFCSWPMSTCMNNWTASRWRPRALRWRDCCRRCERWTRQRRISRPHRREVWRVVVAAGCCIPTLANISLHSLTAVMFFTTIVFRRLFEIYKVITFIIWFGPCVGLLFIEGGLSCLSKWLWHNTLIKLNCNFFCKNSRSRICFMHCFVCAF